MNVWDKCRLQQALAWMYEGAVPSNAPIGPTDVRNANAQMINITAVTSDGDSGSTAPPQTRTPSIQTIGMELWN